MEVGKQRMSWAQMNSTFLVCRAVLPGNGSAGEQIFIFSLVWGTGCWKGLQERGASALAVVKSS